MIYIPDTIINIHALELELDNTTLHQGCGNNVNELVSDMLRPLQEIHAMIGEESYTDCRFLTNLFRAVSNFPVEKFEAFTDQSKKRWIMEEIDDLYEIAKMMINMAQNMKENKEFKTDTTKHQICFALNSEVGSINKCP